MERIGGSLRGCEPSVLDALSVAGWTAGRRIATADWTQELTAAGFELNEVALGVWAEFGGLRIARLPDPRPRLVTAHRPR